MIDLYTAYEAWLEGELSTAQYCDVLNYLDERERDVSIEEADRIAENKCATVKLHAR